MTKLLSLISLLTCLSHYDAKSQAPAYVAVRTAEQIPWEQYSPSAKRFVLAGEAHHVSVIFPFQLSHLRYLVTKGFRHLVWEVPFSTGYIAQQYISTGSDSLLRYLAWSEEALAYWHGVHEINQTLGEGDKLHFWGIDHELGDNTGGAYRAKTFKKALQLLAAGRGDLPPSLHQEFLSLQKESAVQALTDIKRRLQVVQHHPEVASFFGERLPYFKALVNRLDYFKVGRNGEMLRAFKEICSLFRLDSNAKFLGRFGWGHTDKSYKKSMSWLLANDPSSPVKNSTYVIGVQYLNCASRSSDKEIAFENYGIVDNRLQKKTLAALNQQDPAPIKIFTWPTDEKQKGWAKAADVLFVFSGFSALTPSKSNNN